MKKTKNIRLELVINTLNFLIQLQNQIRRELNKKVSLQKLILYYFFKGLSINLKRKHGFVQDFIENDQDLAILNDDLINIDSCIDQYPDDIAATLGGLDEKDRLLQRDLIDQYHLLKAKELRLLQKEDQLAKLDTDSSKLIQEKHELKMQVMIKDAEISNLKSSIDYETKFTQLYKFREEQLSEENRELRNENREQRSTIREMKKLLVKIQRNTDELLRREKSWFNQVVKYATPVLSFLGANMAAKTNKETGGSKTIIDNITEMINQFSLGDQKPTID